MTVYVVGTDGSDTAAEAAKRAGTLAQATGATIHVVCAYSYRATTSVQAGSDVYVLSAVGEAEAVAEQQALAFRLAGVTAAVEGKPAAVLLAEAERIDAELIVVGNRRMQGVQRILGAVANDVAHHAGCDVLIVKTV